VIGVAGYPDDRVRIDATRPRFRPAIRIAKRLRSAIGSLVLRREGRPWPLRFERAQRFDLFSGR